MTHTLTFSQFTKIAKQASSFLDDGCVSYQHSHIKSSNKWVFEEQTTDYPSFVIEAVNSKFVLVGNAIEIHLDGVLYVTLTPLVEMDTNFASMAIG